MVKKTKPKLLLHIGLEKTGTTSIQHALANQRDELAKEGVLYPTSPGKYNHLKLCVHALNKKRFHNLHSIFMDDLSDLNEFSSKLKSDMAFEISLFRGDRVIMSNEHLSSNLETVQQIRELEKFLKIFFGEIKILIYLRRQDSFALSRYSTQIKAGATKDFSTDTTQFFDMDFGSLLSRWETVFGKNALIIKWFEPKSFGNEGLLGDFAKIAGLNLTLKQNYKNKSLDCVKLSFLKHFNAFYEDIEHKSKRLARSNIVKVLESLDDMGPRLELSIQDSTAILNRYKDSNADLIKKYFEQGEKEPDLEPVGSPVSLYSMEPSLEQIMQITKAMWASKKANEQDLNSRINKLIKDRDKARSILEERNTQLKEKDAKIFFFQAENFRLKNLSEEASFAYQKAIKKDPENQTYINRMKSLNKDLTIDSK